MKIVTGAMEQIYADVIKIDDSIKTDIHLIHLLDSKFNEILRCGNDDEIKRFQAKINRKLKALDKKIKIAGKKL